MHEKVSEKNKLKIIGLAGLSAILVGVFLLLPGGDALAAEGINGLVNSGFEQAGASAQDAYGWNPFGSGYTRYNTAHAGSWGIRLSNTDASAMSGAYQRIDFGQTEVKPVFIGGYVRGQNIVNAGGYFGAGLYAEIHLTDGRIVYWNSLANYGSFNWRWVGFDTGTITIDGIHKIVDAPIDYIFVVPILARATGIAYFDDISAAEYEPAQGAVTFMFDDGDSTAYSEAKPVLDSYNYAGSASIITGYVGSPGYMGWNEVKDLAADGWEIVSHGVNHSDLTTLNATRVTRELYSSYRTLYQQGLIAHNFALPYGAYNADILAKAAKYYTSVRAYETGTNANGTFPYEVKIRGVLDTTTENEFTSWIDEAIANHEWVVVVFHEISDSGDDAYHIPPADFAQMIDAVNASGIRVITYDQGISMFGTKNR